MNKLVLIFLGLCFSLCTYSQITNQNQFLELFDQEIKKYNIGDIDKHYDQGYFTTKFESAFFDVHAEVNLVNLYGNCIDSTDSHCINQIQFFFAQNRNLQDQRLVLIEKLEYFDSIQEFLKIRIYSEDLLSFYEKTAIIQNPNNGVFYTVVIDLPSGIGSLNKSYLDKWKINGDSVFNIALKNTLSSLTQNFEGVTIVEGEAPYYLLTDDYDLFVTSALLKLNDFNIPKGKFGSIVSIPNRTVLIAKPIDDLESLNSLTEDFMGLTNYMNQIDDTNSVSTNLYWFNGVSIELIKKDIENRRFKYPTELSKLIKSK